jgi:hypothetical protein
MYNVKINFFEKNVFKCRNIILHLTQVIKKKYFCVFINGGGIFLNLNKTDRMKKLRYLIYTTSLITWAKSISMNCRINILINHFICRKSYVVLSIYILFSVVEVRAQICGTVVTPDQVKFEKLHGPASNRCNIDRVFKELSITAYIVKDSLGQPNITPAAINADIATLNTLFDPIKVSFAVCKFVYIDNYNYDTFVKEQHEAEMTTLYNQPNTINMYFTETIESKKAQVAGYAYFPGGPDVILIKKSGGAGVIQHEMGHFFGLYHTFEASFGGELANESNCSTAGDLLCDTEADPRGKDVNCHYDYTSIPKDANGDYYIPPTDNIMSYYSCPCQLTEDQYNRMVQQFVSLRSYLW